MESCGVVSKPACSFYLLINTASRLTLPFHSTEIVTGSQNWKSVEFSFFFFFVALNSNQAVSGSRVANAVLFRCQEGGNLNGKEQKINKKWISKPNHTCLSGLPYDTVLHNKAYPLWTCDDQSAVIPPFSISKHPHIAPSDANITALKLISAFWKLSWFTYHSLSLQLSSNHDS